jgi:hypothetical protein
LALSGSAVLVALLVGYLLGRWSERQHRQAGVRQAVEAALNEAEASLHQTRWDEAKAHVTRAEALLRNGAPEDLRRRTNQLNQDLSVLKRLEDVRGEAAPRQVNLNKAAQANAAALKSRQEAGDDAEGKPQPVTKEIKLFNGKDLTNFYTWLGSPGKGQKPYGKNNDPEKVFTVHDGMIHISGKVFGGLITEKEYENYHLVAEFKWGEETWPPRKGNARDSGILLHCVGPDGAAGGVWLESIECQMIEGGTGDLILVAGKGRPSLTARVVKRGGQSYYDPKGEPVAFTGGRVNWFGRDPGWKDVKDFRGRQDVERPAGQWNRLECVCDGDRITNILNGTVVNRATQVRPHRGKILFQSEGAEVFFRRIELRPVRKGD